MIYRLTLLAVTALLVSLSTIQGQSNRARAASTSTETAPQETPESPDSAALAGAIQEETERIDRTYVISATRHAQRIYDLPYTGSVVAGPELDRSRSLQDALRESPGVQLQRTSYGQTSPFLRGLTGYHTLMLIDGIRLNNSVLRSGPNEYWGLVDPLSLDRVEVVLGPSSVLYGSDAVGGSVNAVPVRRRDYKPGFHWDRRLYMRYSSAENSITSRAQISGNIGEDFGFVVGGDIASFDDLDGGRGVGRQDHTGYHTAFGDVALDFHLDENWHLGILGQIASLDNVGRTHRTVHAVSFHGTTGGSDRRRNFNWDRELVGVFLDGYDFEGFIDSMRLRLSWHHIGEERDRVRSDGRRDIRGFDVDTYGVALEFVSETTIGRLTYGIDWYHDQVASYRDNFDASGAFTGSSIQGPVGDDATYDLVGIFLQDEVNLHDDLDLILGGRFTYASADAGRVQDPNTGLRTSIDDDFVSAVGSVRVVWSALDELRLFGGVSQAFRAPNLSDLTRFDSARSNEIEIPSPGLDPEDFISLEIGGKVQWEGLSLQAAYAYTFIDDLIVRQPTGAMIGTDFVVQKLNGDGGHVQTIDVGANYDLDANWSAFGTFQWVDGQQETFPTSAPVSSTEPLSRLTPLNGTLGVRWQTTDGRFWLRGWATMVAGQDRLSTRDARDTGRIPPGGTPGYTVFNIEAGFALDDSKRFFAAIENITDKNYRIHGSGQQEAGVNLVVGADFTF